MSVSAATETDNDVQIAAIGGATFDERLAQMASAKAMLDAAYNDLRIGRDAVAEYEKAAADRQAAADELQRAKDEAAAIKTAAADEARKLLEDTAKSRVEILTKANEDLGHAKRLREKVDADAADAAQAIIDAKAERMKREKDLAAREAEADKKLAEASDREAAAAAAEARWKSAIEALRAVVSKA